jgi:hypothetical protein
LRAHSEIHIDLLQLTTPTAGTSLYFKSFTRLRLRVGIEWMEQKKLWERPSLKVCLPFAWNSNTLQCALANEILTHLRDFCGMVKRATRAEIDPLSLWKFRRYKKNAI